jgi:phosphatidylglycerophosphate synthase
MVKNYNRKKNLVKLFGMGDTPLNAIKITGYSGAIPLAGFGCLVSPSLTMTSLGLIVLGGVGALADGFIARKFNSCSVDGAKMAPFFDKGKHVVFCLTTIGLGLSNNSGFL